MAKESQVHFEPVREKVSTAEQGPMGNNQSTVGVSCLTIILCPTIVDPAQTVRGSPGMSGLKKNG